MTPTFFELHKPTLDRAAQAIREQAHWSTYAVLPSSKAHGATGGGDGKVAFNGRMDKPFAQPCLSWDL